MKLLAFTPIAVDDDEVARRQARYDAIAPDGVEVVVRRPSVELPRELATERDIRASDEALVAAYRSEPVADWDGYLPDCVLDPAVHAGASLERPIHGIARLTMHALAGAGLRWRAVARNSAIAGELDRLASAYGTPTDGPAGVLSLSVEDIADETTWAKTLTAFVDGLSCDAVLNGCSAVNLPASGDGPALVDPTQLALQVLASLHGPAR